MDSRYAGFRQRTEATLAKPLLAGFFGIRAERIEAGAVSLLIDHRPELGHAPGWFQGSIVTAIAEFAAALSASSLMPEGWANLTLDQHISFVGSARGERLVARGRVLAGGRTIVSSAADVFVVRGGAEHLCAAMLQTNRLAPAPSPEVIA